TVLAGIIARQNVELELRHRELYCLKRARFWVRFVYALIVLGFLALLMVLSQFVPPSILGD
ncbi:MAG: hypothetical protein M3463_11880, partial [Verrucomicrobiota bacterium]|nr:hypothetical protein [Verrucomicrobiota bacterium]